MDLDIMGEIGHCGHVMYATFLSMTGHGLGGLCRVAYDWSPVDNPVDNFCSTQIFVV